MKRLPAAIALLVLVAVVLLATFTGTRADVSTVAAPVTTPVTATTLVCAPMTGRSGQSNRVVVSDATRAVSPAASGAGTVTATVLAGHKSTTTALKLTPDVTVNGKANADQSLEINATGSVAAALGADELSEIVAGRYRGLSGAHCVAPATDWWFAGAEGRVGFTDTLTLANTAPTAALVSVTVWSDKGPVANTQLDSVRVPARSVVHLPMASVAPDAASLVIHVHATSGAVSAALLDRHTSALRSNGGDNLPPTTPPARSAILAGFAPGAGPRYVIVGNPTGVDAMVTMKLITRSGTFTPTTASQIDVPAYRTRAVSLSAAFGSSPGAVEVTSDQPVVSEGLSVTRRPPRRPDLMWVAATPALTGPAVIAAGREPDGGHTTLVLTAPRAASSVRLTGLGGHSQSIPVPAGRSVAVDITNTIKTNVPFQWSFVVTPTGPGPVYGTRVLSFAGAHGALVTGEPLIGVPKPIVLPPVREDPRVAVK
jgi:Family of unknown function (DUF5719)